MFKKTVMWSGIFDATQLPFLLFLSFSIVWGLLCADFGSQDWGVSWKNYPREGPLRSQPKAGLISPRSPRNNALPTGANGTLGFEDPPGSAAHL